MNKLAVCSGALLALVGTSALAVPGLTNVNQKGSLLVFPEIDTSNGRDTLIFLTNDNTQAVDVKCYYGEFAGRDYDDFNYNEIDQYPKPTQDFQFTLTRNQTVGWRASDGVGTGPALPNFPNYYTGTGQLVCWAVTAGGGQQIKFNHLLGMAKIVDLEPVPQDGPLQGTGQSWEYSAYSFYCNGGNGNGRALTGDMCGETAGKLSLDEKAYDQCGRYIIGQMIPEGSNVAGANANYLSISSCTQNLAPVGEAEYIGQDLVIDVWNADEVKYTGAKEEDVDSWWRFYLGDRKDRCTSCDDNYDEIDINPGKVTFNELKTIVAHYRMESSEGYGLMGVQVQYHARAGYSATTVHHAGKATGEIEWRTQDDNPPERQ